MLLALTLSLVQGTLRAQVVDCLLAEVNHVAVTLFEIRVREAFGLSAGEQPASGEQLRNLRNLLDRVIDRKVVVGSAGKEMVVAPTEISSALAGLRAKLPPGEFETRLADFGLRPGDLEPYLAEDLLYRKIVDQRFGQSVAVTLEEIRSAYDETYVPAQKKRGLEPEPLVSVLDEIEAEIRDRKIAAQVHTWIDGLRARAAVVLKNDCLKILEEGR